VPLKLNLSRNKHNPFDLTKVWPKADYPLIEVRVMELNRCPDNYFADDSQRKSLNSIWPSRSRSVANKASLSAAFRDTRPPAENLAARYQISRGEVDAARWLERAITARDWDFFSDEIISATDRAV
jgi:hypothetical protein